MESNAHKAFTVCNDEKCSSTFKYLDPSIHTFIDGPDPRDHFANERNLLTWMRTGMTMSLLGFITLLDVSAKDFAPSYSFPWTEQVNAPQTNIVAYIFVALGILSICVAFVTYFQNQSRIVNRLLHVGHGWAGYMMILMIMLFACCVMSLALSQE
ncbi:hypothetical protein CLU79DRAFT_837956 [Phycomyces nitens]|nr:hypothetical protein CLU79DRAFT_837956 [Phycomyces nitens]